MLALDAAGVPPTALPLLSDAFTRLMALSPQDRLNTRLLELIVAKDPAAVARLVALAATPALSGVRKIRSLNDALHTLGANRACDALMAIWATAAMPADDDGRKAADYLVHHVFSLCATMRRLARQTRLSALGDSTEILLFPLVDRLVLSVVLNLDTAHPARQAFMAAVHRQSPLRRDSPALQPVFSAGPRLALAWQMPETVVEAVTVLNEQPHEQLPALVQLLNLADAVCAKTPLAQIAPSPLLDDLSAKNVDVTKLACSV